MTARSEKSGARFFWKTRWSGGKANGQERFSRESEWRLCPSPKSGRPMPGSEVLDIFSDDMINHLRPDKPLEVDLNYLFRATVENGKTVAVYPQADSKYFLETLFEE